MRSQFLLLLVLTTEAHALWLLWPHVAHALTVIGAT